MADTLVLEAASDSEPASLATLGCVKIIARLQGLSLTLEELLGDTKPGAELSTSKVLACARRVGLHGTATVFARGDDPKLLKALPAIVRFKDGSSMVLVQVVTQDGVPRMLLEDPNADPDNLLMLDRMRFEQAWTGHVILLKRKSPLTSEAKPLGFGLMMAFLLQERQLFANVAIAALALGFIGLAPALFSKILITRVLSYKAIDSWIVIVSMFVLLVLCEAAFGALRRFFAVRLSARVDVKLAIYVFNKALNLPVDYFERMPLGMTLHRFSHLHRVRLFVAQNVLGTVLDLSVLIFFLPIMLTISPLLTGIVLAVGALLIVWIVMMLPAYRLRSAALDSAESRRGTFVAQNITGIRTVKSLALDARQRHQWDVLTANIAEKRIQEGAISNWIQTGASLFERMMLNLTLAVGIYMTIDVANTVSIGTIFAFYILVQRLIAPIQNIATLIRGFDEARLSLADIGVLANHPEEEGRSGHGLRVPVRGHVEFSDVRFKYRGAVNPALRSVSFEVPAGTTLGVMGRSGSGKTTLTRLLQKLHSDYQGRVKIDGIDVRDFDVDFLRSNLGVVLQENFLFSGTIRENIIAAKPNASFEEMVMAARLAGAEEFIDRLPRGYETAIYEGSPNLSGGQRQRLAIARALITNPRILILDEATSALDAESEAIVNANLRRISQGRTVITISHRLSALVSADAILVLNRGEVYDIGRHHELLDRCDIYSELWHHQNAGLEQARSA